MTGNPVKSLGRQSAVGFTRRVLSKQRPHDACTNGKWFA